MKRIYLILLLGLVAVIANAQIPTPPDPSCAYCGVNLKKGEAHKSTCPYYEAPKEEESSSSSLKDYTPMPGMSSVEYTLIYEVGVNGKKPCSHCRSLIHHPWCEIINMQKWAKEYWAKAESASTEAARKQALWDYKRMVDNLKLFINLNYTLEESKPLPEVKSRLNISSEEYGMLYRVGVRGFNIKCPVCGSMAHDGGCPYFLLQLMAVEAKDKAKATTTLEEREKAIIDFHVCEDNLLASYEQNMKKKQEEAQQAQQNTSPAPASYQHLSSVDIKGNYDKKLGYSDWATAYGKTFPNGEELWVLYDSDGQEVGQFSKVEPASVPSGLDVFLVRDFNGKWGVYNAAGYAIVAPEYESVKVLVAQQGGEKYEYYDVTQRDGLGMLRHGIINGAIADDDNQTIPCVCDRIELIDRSPSNYGVLAKITVDGRMGIMDTDDGDVIIQPSYSYVNTYFTPKGMYFIVGDGTNFGAYFAETMELVVSPDDGKTLDQVRNILDQRDR
ncbi:MAG: hypothetical protein IKW83_00090 [Muribaculaceae bacterium]|nr:hypothetical protein [Muribaculaceae bacterium]